MPNQVKILEIERISQNGHWHKLVMRCVSFDGWQYRRCMKKKET